MDADKEAARAEVHSIDSDADDLARMGYRQVRPLSAFGLPRLPVSQR